MSRTLAWGSLACSVLLVLLASLTLAVGASCSSRSSHVDVAVVADGGGAVSGTVGVEGARLDLPGIASLDVPPNALAAAVSVQLAAVDPPMALPGPLVSKVVAFTPHGLSFASPPQLSLRYPSTLAKEGLSVVRLADPSAQAWQTVGGVDFAGGVATFESTSFSDYAVIVAACVSAADPPCTSACTCCGTASCVDVRTSPKHCGACGNDCGANAYCDSHASCTAVAASRLCDNAKLLVIHGELPPLTVVSPEQTTDGVSAAAIANAIARRCGNVSITTSSQAAAGVLDPCTDAPLQTGGTTDVIVGGGFGQRVARFLQANALAPYVLQQDVTGKGSFSNRAGTHLVDFAATDLNPKHDYFVIALVADPRRGALLLNVYGVGWEGTPAAVYYFNAVALPEIASGRRTWQRNLLVEWTDDGDGVKDAGDTFRIVARDQ